MPPDPITILGAVGTIINVGALIFLVAAFYRGDIFAKPVVDRILALYEKRAEELFKIANDRLKEVTENLRDLTAQIQIHPQQQPPPYGKGKKKL